MDLDPVFLSRLQFAWVIAWHIILPAFTVGLASYIAVLEALYLITRRDVWLRTSRFWTRIFAVSFGMGVVSGIVMPFQLGTNWSRWSDQTANILSPLLGYEGLTAFFLESSFLGVLLFGRKLVPPWAHALAGAMVALGTLISTFWILVTNSWMQTPAGFTRDADGRFFPANWLEIIFNPSFPYRFVHTVTAFYITTAFVVLAVGCGYLARRRHDEEARLLVRMALNLLTLLVPLQILFGDMQGLNTREYQPAKLAAIEGRWETAAPAPLTLFAIPDQKAEKNLAEIEIPELGSLILTHTLDGAVKGLKEFAPDQRPPVAPVFFAFRIMVAIGMLMLLVIVLGQWLRLTGALYRSQWFLRACQWGAPLGFIAVIAGWTTTEVGRQPWTVFGLLRTADSVSPSLTGGDVALSMTLYMAVYLLMYPTGLAFIASLVRKGPSATEDHAPIEAGHAADPVAAAAVVQH
jgi:cytochrome d ubiquinol oxidase subunit I